MTCPSCRAFWRRLALSVALGTTCTGVAAAEEIDSGILDESSVRWLEQGGGFIVDRTITHFGAEFVRHFAAQWRQLAAAESVDVAIVERPSARWGSLVYIEHRQRPVARVFLYAGRSASIRPLAEAAARHVATRTADDALARMLTRDPDLGKEEFR